MGNAFAKNAEFLKRQLLATSWMEENYREGRLYSTDALGEPIIWAKSPDDAVDLIKQICGDHILKMDFLSDLTAYDNVDGQDGPKRFVVVYQIFSTTQHTRIRIKLGLDLNESAKTITPIWEGANWLEREVFDMFGIKFQGHPNLRRILMDERFTGYPLRKEYPLKQREPFADNIPLHLGAHPMPKHK